MARPTAQMPVPALPAPAKRPGVVYPPEPPASLAALRKETLKTMKPGRLSRPRPPAKPRPWFAVPVEGFDRFEQFRLGGLYTLQVCECADCVALLDTAMRGRKPREANSARLLLVEMADQPRFLIVRGTAALANNVRISRAWTVEAAPDTLLTPGECARLRHGHLVQIARTTLTRAANYLVARLPAPPAIPGD